MISNTKGIFMRFLVFILFIFFCIQSYAVPTFTEIIKKFDKKNIEQSEKDLSAAMDLTDRRNMPTVADDKKAFQLLKLSANNGNVYAMHNLALRYKNGHGVQADTREAFNWYLLASKLDFAGSQNNLGDLYEKGEGVNKSYSDAMYWYTRSAMQGEPTAYLSLGHMYQNGKGVEKNLVDAAFWFAIAKAYLPDGRNQKSAAESLISCLASLNESEKIEVDLRARIFKPYRQEMRTLSDKSN